LGMFMIWRSRPSESSMLWRRSSPAYYKLHRCEHNSCPLPLGTGRNLPTDKWEGHLWSEAAELDRCGSVVAPLQ
jgi:hypothetical protein